MQHKELPFLFFYAHVCLSHTNTGRVGQAGMRVREERAASREEMIDI